METNMEIKKELVVIGGGPAGMAAALEAYRQGIKDILIIERDHELGGILTQCIHSGFGLHLFGEELTGPEYAGRFIDEVQKYGIEYITDSMVLTMTGKRVLSVVSPKLGFCHINADAIVLAMGCRERTRGALNIPGTRPAGVISAGTAQRYVNIEGYMPGREVVILGSGDIGLIMARRMTLEGAKVKMVCELMPYSGGLQRNIVQCLDDYGIPLKLSHTVIGINGKDRVESIVVAQVDEKFNPINETAQIVPCDTLMLSVGLIPENELTSQAEIESDKVTSGAVVDECMMTSAEGIFACGNVLHVHDLVDFVTEESYRAGYFAAQYIKGEITGSRKERINTVAGNGVRYVVPQMVKVDNLKEKEKLFFRVDKIYRNKKIVLSNNEKIIKTIKKPKLAPGEMENIVLNREIIEAFKNSGYIKIEVE